MRYETRSEVLSSLWPYKNRLNQIRIKLCIPYRTIWSVTHLPAKTTGWGVTHICLKDSKLYNPGNVHVNYENNVFFKT